MHLIEQTTITIKILLLSTFALVRAVLISALVYLPFLSLSLPPFVSRLFAGYVSPAVSTSVSPTAYFTAGIWQKFGFSCPELDLLPARVPLLLLSPFFLFDQLLNKFRFDHYVAARQLLIDNVLLEEVDKGNVDLIIELAAGLSPRGWRFMEKNGRFSGCLSYLETDLPEMLEVKKQLFSRLTLSSSHQFVVVDALKEEGEGSLLELSRHPLFLRSSGIAVVVEGLFMYLNEEQKQQLLKNVKKFLSLSKKPHSSFLLTHDSTTEFRKVLASFGVKMVIRWLVSVVGGRMYVGRVEEAMLKAGFSVKVQTGKDLITKHHKNLGNWVSALHPPSIVGVTSLVGTLGT